MNKQGLLTYALVFLLIFATSVRSETFLRLDEVAVGEIDPAKGYDYADSVLAFNLYDTLVLPRQGGTGYAPHLAESWTSNGTSYTFKLRDNIKFRSGNPLRAEDVVYSLERMQALDAGLSYLFEAVSAKAIDETKVVFQLDEPYGPFVASLIRLPIVDKVLVEKNNGSDKWGETFLGTSSAGSGAYSIVSHDPNKETVMAKWDGYFLGVSEAAPDKVSMRYGLDSATVRQLIAEGKHDIASQWLPPEVIKSMLDDGAQLLTEKSGSFYFKMNTAKAPLDDVNCRLALANAFDYETAIHMIAINDDISAGLPSTGAIPLGMYGANPPQDILTQDISKAKQYLEACKYDVDDMNIEISWIAEVPLEERFAVLMQYNFDQLGIKSEIKKISWASYEEQVSKPENTPHISQIVSWSVTGDPDTLLWGMYHSSTPGTWQSPERLNDKLVDQYLEAGRKAADETGRIAAYQKLNSRLMELAATIYGFDRQSIFVASNRVRVPALSDPGKAFGVDAMGFTFRLMGMVEYTAGDID